MIQVSQNVYVETGIFACNLGVITTTEGNILIDTPERPSDAVRWRDEISKKGEVRFLINTEEHPDHAHSSHFLPGTLITHEKTRERLARLPVEDVLERVKRSDPEGSPFMGGFRLRLADITFSESLSLFLGGQTVELFHLPGHSEGGIAVFIPAEKVVFTTDVVFHRRKSWLHEATPSRWIESLKKLRELDVDVIVPGHGDLCKKDYLDEQAAVVENWVDAVKSAIQEGLSEEEAVARISPPDPHPKQPKTPMTEEQLNRAIISRLYHLYAE